MPIKLVCRCGRNLIVPDERSGRTLECPKCGHRMKVPGEIRELASDRETAKPGQTAMPSAMADQPLKPPTKPSKLRSGKHRDGPKRPTPAPSPIKETVKRPPPLPVSAPVTEPVKAAEVVPEQPDEDAAAPEVIPPATSPPPLPPIAEPQATAAAEALAPRSPQPPAPSAPRRRFGYEHDADKLGAAYLLATLVALLGIFTMVPGVLDVVRFLGDVDDDPIGRFAFVVFFLGLVHVGYAFYLGQLPDWGTSWVLTAATLLQASLYAAVSVAIYLRQGHSQLVQFLDLGPHVASGRATAWCFVMFCLTGLVAYFCGRVSIRWRRAFMLVRTARGQ